MSDDAEKAAMAEETFVAFCSEFGDDAYSIIILDVLLEGIMNEEIVFVFGESEQEGDQGDHSSSGGVDSDEQIDGSVDFEAAADLGEEDSSDSKRQPDAL
jgi:hypothetical protein